ncbi:NAD(P)/FAD-dependent oxidoreductase [Olsenella urininfantis]|uniref:NAD(P)/FAD-dependent oxidoreductase n=1 Tax=Olsenella urininfantis TaxID=1871033 RepID=UPI0009859E3B|nr:NAD(P)/FAD-dependent oxidoreductase [Olsenella urininfantis]
MNERLYDVAIIGAGVSGCAVAREVSRLRLDACVVEAEGDVCCGTTKANSAIVHAGFDAAEGTLMARLNVEGNALFGELSRELDFAFDQIGSLVVCTSEEGRPALEELRDRGVRNGVPGLRIVERDELERMEPNISDAAICALFAPTAGICDPFGLNVALAENAAENGVEFIFDAPVTGVSKSEGVWELCTAQGPIRARVVVNAGGVHADELHNMVSEQKMEIVARRGEYELLDTTAGTHVRHTVFMLPNEMGKGVLVTPTIHGNLLVGPTADDIDDKDDTRTTAAGLRAVVQKSALTVKNIPFRETVTSFSGLRAHQSAHEFIIEEVADAPGFVDCAGIESPGLTASPAIGRMVAGIVRRILSPEERRDFQPQRKGFANLNHIPADEWNELIKEDPAYGTIVCRCCRVSEAQIRDACRRVPGARSLDGVKSRTGACMGRCQAGFCTPRILEILCEEIPDMDMEHASKCGPGSEYVVGKIKGSLEGGGQRA